MGLVFTKFGNLTIFYILTIQASKFFSVSDFKDFGTSQLQFEICQEIEFS